MDDLSAYTPAFRLLEESKKFWDYGISDKLIYIREPFEAHLNPMWKITENYRSGGGWLEILLTFIPQGNTYDMLAGTVVALRNDAVRKERHVRIGDRCATAVNPPVLVDNAHLVEPPQEMVLNGVASMVRLKRFNYTDSLAGNVGSLPFKSSTVGLFQNRKLNTLCGLGDLESGECPDRLIQCGAEVVEELPNDDAQILGRVPRELDSNEVKLPFKIIFESNSVRLTLVENTSLFLKKVQVFFRPGEFQIGIG